MRRLLSDVQTASANPLSETRELTYSSELK